MKAFDDVLEFDRKLHADYLKLYAKDKGEYCDVKGNQVFFNLSDVKFFDYKLTLKLETLQICGRFHLQAISQKKGY